MNFSYLDVKREIVKLANLYNIYYDDRSFDKSVEEIIQLFRKIDLIILGEIKTYNSSELNIEALQEDSEEVRYQNNKEESEAKLGTRRDLFVQKGGKDQGHFPQEPREIKVYLYQQSNYYQKRIGLSLVQKLYISEEDYSRINIGNNNYEAQANKLAIFNNRVLYTYSNLSQSFIKSFAVCSDS